MSTPELSRCAYISNFFFWFGFIKCLRYSLFFCLSYVAGLLDTVFRNVSEIQVFKSSFVYYIFGLPT
jgi:hypothetical protein